MNGRLLGLAVLLVCFAPLDTQTRHLTYEDHYRILRSGDAAISPDGTAWPPNGDEAATWFRRPDDPTVPPFRTQGLEGAPVFDPTHRTIAFTRPVPPEDPPPESRELSEEEHKIVERFDGRSYDWMRFRFDRRGYLADPNDPFATPRAQIFVLPREGGEVLRISDLNVNASDIDWRPDGEAVTFVPRPAAA